MNRGELFEAVREYANRPNLTDVFLGLAIASVEGILNRRLREHPRNYRRTNWTPQNQDPATGDPIEVSDLLPLPMDAAQIVWLGDSNGLEYEQYPITVKPGYVGFVERGDCLQVTPKPSQDTPPTYYLDYHAFLRPLQNAADSNWVSTYFSDVYFYGMLKEVAVKTKMQDKLATWTVEFNSRVTDLEGQGWNQNFATAPRARLG